MHPAIMRKYLQALHPDMPPQEGQAILKVLFNLPLLPPVTRAQFLAGRLHIWDLVKRLRGYQTPEMKQRVAPLVEALSWYRDERGFWDYDPTDPLKMTLRPGTGRSLAEWAELLNQPKTPPLE